MDGSRAQAFGELLIAGAINGRSRTAYINQKPHEYAAFPERERRASLASRPRDHCTVVIACICSRTHDAVYRIDVFRAALSFQSELIASLTGIARWPAARPYHITEQMPTEICGTDCCRLVLIHTADRVFSYYARQSRTLLPGSRIW